MAIRSNEQWEKLYSFLLACGSIHEPYQFSIEIVTGLREFCEFDQALVYILDGNRKVRNQYLMNFNDRWSNLYLEYYSKMDTGKYGIHKDVYETEGKPFIDIIFWQKEPPSEFISNYIRALGLKCSLYFVLFDLNGLPRTVFSLDKINQDSFTDSEIATLRLMIPHLNNLHKNFFIHPTGRHDIKRLEGETADLTERESEVVNLLCQGVSTANISKSLRITPSTTYKHIAHIYEKLHVSSQQELLVRLLNQQSGSAAGAMNSGFYINII